MEIDRTEHANHGKLTITLFIAGLSIVLCQPGLQVWQHFLV